MKKISCPKPPSPIVTRFIVPFDCTSIRRRLVSSHNFVLGTCLCVIPPPGRDLAFPYLYFSCPFTTDLALVGEQLEPSLENHRPPAAEAVAVDPFNVAAPAKLVPTPET